MKNEMNDATACRKRKCVRISVTREDLRDELLKRTTYIALPVRADKDDDDDRYERLLLTVDEEPWVTDRLQEAGDRVADVVSAYLVNEGCSFDECGHYCLTLLLPLDTEPGIEHRVMRLVREIMVLYVLMCWFCERLPEKFHYLSLQYNEAIELLRTRINRRTTPVLRSIRAY